LDDFQIVEDLMQEFCTENMLLMKSMKEIHYLCLQLEKMLQEDIVKESDDIKQNFIETIFA
jgi:hypothetical protein